MNKINNRKISVILSAKDSESSLGNAIESILNQTYENFELLIMDDGSTDNTYQIVSQFSSRDKRIKLLKNKENQGLTISLNRLVQHSRGEYIARQDADDFSYPNRLEEQYKYLISKNLDACTTKAISLQSSKIIHKKSQYLPKKIVIKFKNPFVHGTLLIKKSILERLNNYDENFYYSQDYKLVTDLIDSGYKINILNKVLYKLNTENNISSTNKEEQEYYADCVRKNLTPLR
tara:strand:- start:10634 stop:11332 length:699 start_codon:yes stop_codon:yes gene_type:complete